MKTDRRLLTIFLVVFVDLLGFGLILPLIPFYANDFGANAFVAGLLVASYAAAQLIGAPLLGRLSDRYGRRPILLVSILGTAVGFVLLGFATTLWMLFASRIIDGLTGGNISVAQAYLSDITDQKNRSKAFGLIGAAFGIGFIIGPAVGGFLSGIGSEMATGGAINWQYALPAFAAAGLAFVNVIAVYLWLPESLSAAMRTEMQNRPKAAFNLQSLRNTFRRPYVGPLLNTRFWFGLAFATFQTIFPLFALYQLGLNESATAYILSYVGILIVLVQGVGIRYITERFSDRHLIFASTLIMGPSLLLWAFTPTIAFLLIILIPIAVAGGIFNTVINSALSKSVTPQEVGGTLGLGASVESSTRVLGPTAGGALLQAFGPWAPGVFAALILAGLSAYTWRNLVHGPEPQIAMPEPARS